MRMRCTCGYNIIGIVGTFFKVGLLPFGLTVLCVCVCMCVYVKTANAETDNGIVAALSKSIFFFFSSTINKQIFRSSH